ncbi:MAG: hypothetical protein UT32_C0014G0022 [Parcubacteria group bacterium GW2011_GWC2_39_14]|nr:MAG: hypothetical protein UT32_C0014G0022 [Parcubacteria group bacterium GW2011_GWC2_39_14]KKR54470.1 MAG: hypothetical protein UT91_C0015G0022 [Parcubacteria group bacterium GW2011_GWA2_40_23]
MPNEELSPLNYNQSAPETTKRRKVFQVLLVVVLVLIFGVELGYIIYKERVQKPEKNVDQVVKVDGQKNEVKKERGLKPFENPEEFKAYLVSAAELSSGYSGFSMGNRSVGAALPGDFELAMPDAVAPMIQSTEAGLGAGDSSQTVVDRFSETNVQVQGIDEPDIVKTDGNEIYLSTSFYKPIVEPQVKGKKIIPLDYGEYYDNYGNYTSLTTIIKALPLETMGIDANIDLYGNLLLKDKTLVVLASDKIRAYDVADPKKPVQKWELTYVEDNQYSGARLYGDKLYLITQTYVGDYSPCPIPSYYINGVEISVACSDIYHPIEPTAVDTTYNVSVLDINSGTVINKTSILGSSADSQIYMSADSIYLSYNAPTDILKVIVGFFAENADVFPAELVAKLQKVVSYDLSSAAKMTEFESLMNNYTASLSKDDELKMQNEMENRMNDYLKKHVREFMETGIVKINVDGLKVAAQGFVPGDLLNQFSMDEYEGNLRVATTSGGRGSYFFNSDQSINDVYILDKALNISGSVNDLGAGERIYSVRFIADKGYVVTFRETDPFYVLNLKNPKAPELSGELKIPGYSSYLHPLKENIILGIGREDQNVKLSLFDVSDPRNPVEISKYSLTEYWSDVLTTHHAFLQDEKYQIFFMPGSEGGYIFSYADNKLSLTKAVSGVRAQRGLFINDYFYIIGENNLIVLDEKKWERVKELKLE